MKTVFLIDDDDDDREIFEEALQMLELDLNFTQAEDGLEAFENLRNPEFPKPDVIFLDLNMPKMDGRQFLVKIKQTENFSDIPVVIYSTSSNVNDINFAMQNQAAKFVTKHHSIEHLRNALQQTLRELL